MSGVSADSAVLSGLAEIMKESRESLAEMQKGDEKASAEQAKIAANSTSRLYVQVVSCDTTTERARRKSFCVLYVHVHHQARALESIGETEA